MPTRRFGQNVDEEDPHEGFRQPTKPRRSQVPGPSSSSSFNGDSKKPQKTLTDSQTIRGVPEGGRQPQTLQHQGVKAIHPESFFAEVPKKDWLFQPNRGQGPEIHDDQVLVIENNAAWDEKVVRESSSKDGLLRVTTPATSDVCKLSSDTVVPSSLSGPTSGHSDLQPSSAMTKAASRRIRHTVRPALLPPKARHQTVVYVPGTGSSSELRSMARYCDTAEEPSRISVEGGHVRVVAEVAADNSDMEQRVRQSILDNVVHAKVVKDTGTKKGLWIGAISVLLVTITAVAIGLNTVFGKLDDSPSVGPSANHPTSITSEKQKALAGVLAPAFDASNLTSPQRSAFNWLLLNDTVNITAESDLLERFSLVILYYATNGPYWTDQLGFLEASKHHCEWKSSSASSTILCHRNRAREINIVGNQLEGSIPSELMHLSQLRQLELSSNQLSETIPSELGTLTELTKLALDSNNLSGRVPSEVAQLAGLHVLLLFANQFVGPFPTLLSPKLTTLDFRNNSFSGNLEGIFHGSLTNLAHLNAESNELSSTLPVRLEDHSKLTLLHVGTNHLTGLLPTTIGLMSNLRSLALGNNYLTGSVPDAIGNLSKLTHLDVCCNDFTGSLPTGWSKLSRLGALFVESNDFTGLLPHSWNKTSLRGLHILHLQDNPFLAGNLDDGFCSRVNGSSSGEFVADCLEPNPHVVCSCCDICCDFKGGCNSMKL